MSLEFFAQANPVQQDCEELSNLSSRNPFHTFGYAQARRGSGSQPWLIGMRVAGRLAGGCLGFTSASLLSRSLEIPSLPELSEDAAFWDGLMGFCRQQRIQRLLVDSFASTRVRIPPLPGEAWRRSRREFVMELGGAEPWKELSSNHQRNIKRARVAAIEIRQGADQNACRDHAHLVMASLERRSKRGEKVLTVSAEDVSPLIQAGAAQIFQAVLNGQAVSSILLLMAPRGAYYQSAGTTPEGMSSGASHFLIYETALRLRAMGMEAFNLGGAQEAGLERFKSGFGTRPVALEAAEFLMEGKVARRAKNAARFLRRLMP